MGFSSNSSIRQSSFIFSTPKRVTSSVDGSSLHTTVISAFFCDMVFQDFVVIQLVHTVTGSDDHIGLMASFQEIQVLIDGICGTAGTRSCSPW